jgi:hypothetical protein
MKCSASRLARRLVYSVLGGLLIVAASGCRGQLTKVHGKVTLDGKPLADAGVQFHPIGGHGVPAEAITDNDGLFHMDTHSEDDGVWPGEYKVVVNKYEMDPPMQQKIDPSDPKSTARAYAAAAKLTNKPRKYLVPKVYLREQTTPLRWKVPDDNGRTLELSSGAK